MKKKSLSLILIGMALISNAIPVYASELPFQIQEPYVISGATEPTYSLRDRNLYDNGKEILKGAGNVRFSMEGQDYEGEFIFEKKTDDKLKDGKVFDPNEYTVTFNYWLWNYNNVNRVSDTMTAQGSLEYVQTKQLDISDCNFYLLDNYGNHITEYVVMDKENYREDGYVAINMKTGEEQEIISTDEYNHLVVEIPQQDEFLYFIEHYKDQNISTRYLMTTEMIWMDPIIEEIPVIEPELVIIPEPEPVIPEPTPEPEITEERVIPPYLFAAPPAGLLLLLLLFRRKVKIHGALVDEANQPFLICGIGDKNNKFETIQDIANRTKDFEEYKTELFASKYYTKLPRRTKVFISDNSTDIQESVKLNEKKIFEAIQRYSGKSFTMSFVYKDYKVDVHYNF